MTGDLLAFELAATFTAGCILIHALRAHAKAMTPVLGILAACLGMLVALTGLAGEQPAESSGRTAAASRSNGYAPVKPTPQR